jgi:hypothetical protein
MGLESPRKPPLFCACLAESDKLDAMLSDPGRSRLPGGGGARGWQGKNLPPTPIQKNAEARAQLDLFYWDTVEPDILRTAGLRRCHGVAGGGPRERPRQPQEQPTRTTDHSGAGLDFAGICLQNASRLAPRQERGRAIDFISSPCCRLGFSPASNARRQSPISHITMSSCGPKIHQKKMVLEW